MTERKLILGLDVAGRTGITEGFIGERPTITSERFHREEESVVDACGLAVQYMAAKLRNVTPAAIFIEAIVPEVFLTARGISNHNSQMIRTCLWGAIAGVASAKGIPVFPASVGRVRTFVLGRGHGIKGGALQKKAVFKWCEDSGWAPPDLDGADSAAVWWWGCHETQFGLLANNPFGPSKT